MKFDTLPLKTYFEGSTKRACIDCGEWTVYFTEKYKKFVPLCEACEMDRFFGEEKKPQLTVNFSRERRDLY